MVLLKCVAGKSGGKTVFFYSPWNVLAKGWYLHSCPRHGLVLKLKAKYLCMI